ncbi:aminoglycoside phosphotransferase family protein [Microbispora sp. NBC_01189]|uniref:phosphotransferase family protein n=1 Tax=Microbispora sp. NBC_01189 TaxID=2903583 RepID=UPI002E0E4ED0|nr:aminoglycoside phosphotransferase family protein [Microbispora sp. NBC_01189]
MDWSAAVFEEIRRLLARHLPGFEVRVIERLGEGQDNAAYEVNGELVVRQSKAGDPTERGEAVDREAALLAVMSEVSPLPVPRPVLVVPEAGVLAYPKLPGLPLNRHPVPEPARLAAPLGAFLSALHMLPVPRVEDLVPRDAYPLRDLREEAEGDYAEIAGRLPAEERALVEVFLAAEAPADPATLTFCHNDLGSEHVLVDVATSTVTGVIDWTDAAVADPAYDLALVYRDLGPAVLARTLEHYQGGLDAAARERMLFYARCALLEDIAYGLRTGVAPYAEAGLAHLGRTFS